MKKHLLLFVFISFIFLKISLAVFADISGLISRLSTANNGAGANGSTARSAISPSGRLVAFETFASNLIANDNNGAADIYVTGVDNKTKVFRTSIGRQRIEANGPSSNPSVSAATPNGSYLIAYESDATNLGRNQRFQDSNNFQDIYATLFPKAFTFRISRAADGGYANGRSESPDVTIVPEPNRLFVAYASNANNITPDDHNSFSDIYLSKVTSPKELKENTDLEDKFINTRISLAASGAETDGDSSAPKISGDGNFIVYESVASNLISGLSISGKNIYLYDVKKRTTALISKSSGGIPGNSNSRSPGINYDGRYIVYVSSATNIVEDGVGLSNPTYQVFRYDRLTGKNERVNITASGISADGPFLPLLTARIEASGRFVIFSDRASNLVANDNNNLADVFIKDMSLGTLEKISRSTDGSATDAASLFPAINRSDFTALTGLATFTSGATNIVGNDVEGFPDLFLTKLTFPPLPLSSSTSLNVPPSVSLSGKTAKFTFEKFSGGIIKKSRHRLKFVTHSDYINSRSSSSKVQYAITYSREASGNTRKEVTKIISKKNTISLKGLKPGTYSSSYKAQVVKNDKVVSQSSSSPAQRFTVS